MLTTNPLAAALGRFLILALLWACVALVTCAAAWCWTEAVWHVLRVVRLHWMVGEYLAHRKRFKVWLKRARGEKVYS